LASQLRNWLVYQVPGVESVKPNIPEALSRQNIADPVAKNGVAADPRQGG